MSATLLSVLSSVGWHDGGKLRVGKGKQGWRWRRGGGGGGEGGGGGRGTLVCFAVVSNAMTMPVLACVWFFCHCFPRPWCVPAETQTAKDSSRQDLMTRVISLRETCPQRQPDLSPQALISSRTQREGASPLFHHHHCHRWQKARVGTVRNRPLMCQTPPLVCHHCPLCHPWEQMMRRSREDGLNSDGVDKLSASCS